MLAIRRNAAVLMLVATVTVSITAGAKAADCPWVASSEPVDTRVGQVLSLMTQGEKLHMVHGALTDLAGITGPLYAGVVYAIPRLCIPQLGLLDGPVGAGDGLTGVTQLPAPIALAATWDPALASSFGGVIGSEVAGKGANVGLAPALDIARDPRAGRGFEAFGEDPYLASRFGVATARAIQDKGVIAQPKHFAVYNQETLRDTVADNAIVDERTMQEIYFPPFEAVVADGAAGSIMCSYNYVNGVNACNNAYLMSQVLKGQWGFKGFVTSDWYGMHASAASANAGLDMQMPDDCYFGSALAGAIAAGRVEQSRLDDMVSRILRSMFSAGLFEHPATGTPSAIVTTPAHADVAKNVAENSMVLLKNDASILPLDGAETIAIIGQAAKERAITGGGGSSSVNPPYVVSPFQGIADRAEASVTYDDGTNPATAAATARSADVALVFAASKQGEFKDRPTIELFPTDTLMISAVAAANPNTIVVLNTGAPVAMPWLGAVKGILQAWYPGQEYGRALASIVFGDVNPGAKLPVTFPQSIAQVPARTPLQWPGTGRVEYSEGLGVGYRWYDENDIQPLFPFGYGLSYTTFLLSNARLSASSTADGSITVGADVTNTGSRSGAEVVQLYLSFPSGSGEPPKVLRGFTKVSLYPGQTTGVYFDLDARSLSHWDTDEHRWIASPGTFTARMGNSSRELPLTVSFTLANELRPGSPTPPPPTAPEQRPEDEAADNFMCPKDFFAPFVNGSLSVTGFPPVEVAGRPVP